MRKLGLFGSGVHALAVLVLLAASAGLGCQCTQRANPAIDKTLETLIGGPVNYIANAPRVPPLNPEVGNLVAAGRQDIPYMLEKVHSPDLRVRMYCAYALGEIGDERAAEPLIDLVEDMRTSWRGSKEWRQAARSESLTALSKIKSPLISAYALRTILSMSNYDLCIEGDSYTSILTAQGVEADIRRAVDALRERRQKNGPNANIDAALEVLSEER